MLQVLQAVSSCGYEIPLILTMIFQSRMKGTVLLSLVLMLVQIFDDYFCRSERPQRLMMSHIADESPAFKTGTIESPLQQENISASSQAAIRQLRDESTVSGTRSLLQHFSQESWINPASSIGKYWLANPIQFIPLSTVSFRDWSLDNVEYIELKTSADFRSPTRLYPEKIRASITTKSASERQVIFGQKSFILNLMNGFKASISMIEEELKALSDQLSIQIKNYIWLKNQNSKNKNRLQSKYKEATLTINRSLDIFRYEINIRFDTQAAETRKCQNQLSQLQRGHMTLKSKIAELQEKTSQLQGQLSE